MKMILDYDPQTGISHWTEYDEASDTVSCGVDQEVTPILEANKAEYNADHGSWGDGQKVASIPLSLYAEWVREGKDKDQTFLRKFLNDIGFRAFRTRPGAHMTIYAKAGEVVTCVNGHPVAKFLRDVVQGEKADSGQMEWFGQKPPDHGDPLPICPICSHAAFRMCGSVCHFEEGWRVLP